MAKIPFTLEAWLKDKSQKVETRDGRLVHNIWRIKEPSYKNNRKAEVCALIDGEEDALVFFEGGRYLPSTKDTDSPFDLFIITPEPEPSEFEKKLSDVVGYAISLSVAEPKKPTSEFVKEYAAELLAIARKELEPEIKAEALKEIEQDPESSYAFKRGVEYGKEEALKDFPMWKPAAMAYDGDRLPRIDWMLNRLVARFEEGIFYLDINDLYKLPGFKEGSHD